MMEESKIETVVEKALIPLWTTVNALGEKVDVLERDVRSLRNWTIATSMTTILVVMGLLSIGLNVFDNYMEALQLALSK